MSCRDEILAAVHSLLGPDKATFTIDEVLHLMACRGIGYPATTIRTHISAIQCANAPKNHSVKYDDFVRVGPGLYRLLGSTTSLRVPTSSADASAASAAATTVTYAVFEQSARVAMEAKYGVTLSSGAVRGVRKQFDFVSADGSVVGDAKFYARVNGTGLPPAKYATIAEYVWLLEKTSAKHRFMIFWKRYSGPEGVAR